jgi:hypothetical protein
MRRTLRRAATLLATSATRAVGIAVAFVAFVAVAAVVVVAVAASPAAAQDPAPAPGVTIEKTTNGEDADDAPGPAVEAGQAVTWTWTVVSTGTTALYDIVVTDSSGVRPDCDVDGDGQPDGTNIHPGPLEPGQTFSCGGIGGADHDPATGPFSAVGRVRASDFAATTIVEAGDPSHHTPAAPVGPEPGVAIQTLVNGQVAGAADGPLIGEGAAVTWTYVVTNTGNVPLTGVEVQDQSGLTVDCGDGSPVVPGRLDPGASASCSANATAADQSAGLQSTTGSVVAAAIDPATGSPIGQLQASDPSAYVPVQMPGRLAFTGAGDLLVPIGLALTLLGGGLVVLAGTARGRRAQTRSSAGQDPVGQPEGGPAGVGNDERQGPELTDSLVG